MIKSRSMPLEEKIRYLECISSGNCSVDDSSDNCFAFESINYSNVVENIKNAYKKDKMLVSQITRCECIGIKFTPKESVDYQINYLKSAIEEGIDINDYVCGSHKSYETSINAYVNNLRQKYAEDVLSDEQVTACVDDLKIIFSNEQLSDFVNNKIKEAAYKNCLYMDSLEDVFK